MDKYYYARDHKAGPGMWCVRGPNSFELSGPFLQKGQAQQIAILLSKEEDAVHTTRPPEGTSGRGDT